MLLRDFWSVAKLVTNSTLVDKPYNLVNGAHNRFDKPFGRGWIHCRLNEILPTLDSFKVEGYIGLDGGWIEETGRWHICDLYLPYEVLMNLNRNNAARLPKFAI